ncbi:uncharacterized protein F5147DRAFT_787475 [Suillus discolor]|uniref:Uncharacterized protein n=1 Tax=Suillus discolor TaxID=1912936 RepID=A0A9P7EV24_9AGAM|nr:uncharacterized protein F5147DRAFT_787475 [Suillus discolor]KAG2089837.1 hypothetical protein F5147DRAFT_787475 [Suillus discolor]
MIKLWSSAYLSRQLHFLGGHISITEASARAWIEAFFFRASAMLPSNTRMVLNMKQDVPATIVSLSSLSTLFIDYTAIVASQRDANFYVKSMSPYEMKMSMPRSFFVIDAKLCNPSDDVPQAVCKMFAYGKFLEQKVIRGALVNGYDWIFILMTLNDNYDGASASYHKFTLSFHKPLAHLACETSLPSFSPSSSSSSSLSPTSPNSNCVNPRRRHEDLQWNRQSLLRPRSSSLSMQRSTQTFSCCNLPMLCHSRL